MNKIIKISLIRVVTGIVSQTPWFYLLLIL